MPEFTFICSACGREWSERQHSNYEGDRRTAVCECGGTGEWKPDWRGGFRFAFKEGIDACTGVYHPNQRHYENYCREKGFVKLD